jgi:tryptophanyl-tRNA synthetase
MDEKPRVFSGIQPTGRKTLGNYSGGFRQYAQTQEAGDAFFCIVDLHSITVEYDPLELRDSTPTARRSSVRATSPPTPRRRGCCRP